jgi:polyvinyl alcohol dehydrogenase (cytochrome)
MDLTPMHKRVIALDVHQAKITACAALDARTGCTIWEFKAHAPVRTAISVRPDPRGWMAYFGDQSGNAYGVDVTTGQQVWSTRVDPHPTAMVTGAPTVDGDRLLVPVASLEEAAAMRPA